MQNFGVRRDAKGRYTRLQYLARAELLQRSFPNSTAAQELAAHKRRTALIAQMHKQAIAAADHVSAWQRTLKARIDKDARRRKVTIWLFAGTASIVALACVVALLQF
jgi:acyl transferase domain-containing protein